MSGDSAHSRGWVIAEVVFGVPLLIGIIAQTAYPWIFPDGGLRLVLLSFGVASIVGGIAWIVLARRELRHYKQPTDPGYPTHQLVQTGVFARSRNPIYLGCALVLCGIALVTQSLWIVGSLAVSVMICHYVLIVPEERYLTAKFGQTYRDYTAVVRRWYGRIDRRP